MNDLEPNVKLDLKNTMEDDSLYPFIRTDVQCLNLKLSLTFGI